MFCSKSIALFQIMENKILANLTLRQMKLGTTKKSAFVGIVRTRSRFDGKSSQ